MRFEPTDDSGYLYQIVPVDSFPEGPGLFRHHPIYKTMQAVENALGQDWGKYTEGRWKVIAFPLSSQHKVVRLVEREGGAYASGPDVKQQAKDALRRLLQGG